MNKDINDNCLNGGLFIEISNRCLCVPNYTGVKCEVFIQQNITAPTPPHPHSIPSSSTISPGNYIYFLFLFYLNYYSFKILCL